MIHGRTQVTIASLYVRPVRARARRAPAHAGSRTLAPPRAEGARDLRQARALDAHQVLLNLDVHLVRGGDEPAVHLPP